MAKLKLTCALSSNPRTQPIIDGIVSPEAIELETVALHPSEMFFRQLKYSEFDVSEMSCSSLTIATSQAQTEWVGLPVFTSRRFFHTGVLVRTDRGIEQPADLAGKRVGVPEFQQTAALWTRSVLRSEYGVDPRTERWWMERNPDKSHGGQTNFAPPPGIDLQYVPPEKNLGQMLIDGELDALSHWIDARNLVDRSHVDPRQSPNVRYLFDRAAEAKRYYAKTGMYPINHTVVVRRSLLEREPWIARSVYDAFVAAKAAIGRERGASIEPWLATGVIGPDGRAGLARDPMAYGVVAARRELESVTRYDYEQGLAKRRVGLEELFWPESLNW